ncbi:MAG: amidophosphoribosyltransferase [Chitinophagales bacterium]
MSDGRRAAAMIAPEGEHPREECGVLGLYAPGRQVANLAYLGLYALQHRGQESAGLVVSDGTSVRLHKNMGLVAEVFPEEVLAALPGELAIGHVRYSTTGRSSVLNAQPLLTRCSKGTVALAHNGNLVNAGSLRGKLERAGSVFQTTTDTEVIINLTARFARENLEEALVGAARQLKGAYALVAMGRDQLLGLRDPNGLRPLVLGRLGENGWALASESCALASLGAEVVREVAPGEMVIIDRDGLRARQAVPAARPALCVFEFIYFARPDSVMAGKGVHLVRKEIGRALAREWAVEADVVIAAPDSGTSAAMGFAEAKGLPFEVGLIKNRYVGRTFIQPTQAVRSLGVKIKLNPVPGVIAGQRVVLIDDSIVRGTTSARTVQLLREAGAREVHLGIASPPYRHACYYGIDTSEKGELVAHGRSEAEVREFVGADSLRYLSLGGLTGAVGLARGALCLACFDGRYPVRHRLAGAGKFAFEDGGTLELPAGEAAGC